MCNFRHPGPRRVWDGGYEPRVLPPLPRLRLLRWLRWRVPKTQILLLYASLQSSRGPRTLSCDAQAAELVRVAALPCTREHREINFHEKNTRFGRLFFHVFAERSPTPYFYNELSPSRRPSFHNFDSQLAKLHFWPKRGQWDPIGTQLDPICIKSDPNWMKLGPNWVQYNIHKLPINHPSGRYVKEND